MKKGIVVLLVLVLAGGAGGGAYYYWTRSAQGAEGGDRVSRTVRMPYMWIRSLCWPGLAPDRTDSALQRRGGTAEYLGSQAGE